MRVSFFTLACALRATHATYDSPSPPPAPPIESKWCDASQIVDPMQQTHAFCVEMSTLYGDGSVFLVEASITSTTDLGVCFETSSGTFMFWNHAASASPPADLNDFCLVTNRCFCPPKPPSLPPPSTPPMPPMTPTSCDTGSRTDTQTLGPSGKYCYQLNVGATGGCEAYYSQNPTTYKVRFCYNPNFPAIIAGTACVASDEVDCAPPAGPPPPTSPPPGMPPVSPSSCADVAGRQNTQDTNKFCWQISATNPSTCAGFYSMTASGATRLCYASMANPVAGDKCSETEVITCSPSLPPGGPAAPPAPPNAPGMTNKKGLLTNEHMTAAHYAHFGGGKVSHVYNYNIDFVTQAELDFINANNLEFVPMMLSYYAQVERATHVSGWPLATGTNRRCYHWQSALPSNTNNQYYGSEVCTLAELKAVLEATNSMLNVPIRRLAMYNEPWPEAAYAEPVAESVQAYMDYFQPLAQQLGLELISWTTQNGPKAIDYDIEWFKLCMDTPGCDMNHITEFSIHRYNTKNVFWSNNYQPFTGAFWTDRVNNFIDGYGGWTGPQWRDWIQSRKLWISEHSAEQEPGAEKPDNEGTCLRMTGQYGGAGCGQGAVVGPNTVVNSCAWGAGSLAWLLDPAQTIVSGVVLWPTFHAEDIGNQIGGKASRLVYTDGDLTPVGHAFLAMPDNGATVDCSAMPPPSPPPPSPPPASPPSHPPLPPPPSSPPSPQSPPPSPSPLSPPPAPNAPPADSPPPHAPPQPSSPEESKSSPTIMLWILLSVTIFALLAGIGFCLWAHTLKATAKQDDSSRARAGQKQAVVGMPLLGTRLPRS